VAVGVVDAVALDELPLDPLRLVVAVVERVVDLADLRVHEEPHPLAAPLRIPIEHFGVDNSALPGGERLIVRDCLEAGPDRGGDFDGVLGPVEAHLSPLPPLPI
jgi:hypothetical protein